MIQINNILKIIISIFFPISIYLNYTNYMKIYEQQEKTIYLEFSLYSIIFLLSRFINNPYQEIFLFIPLVISLIKNKPTTATIISIFILIITKNSKIITLIKIIFYFIIHFLPIKNKYLLIFILELIFINYKNTFNIPNNIILISVFILIIYQINFLLNLQNSATNLNEITKELNREKLLRTSISKLTHELKNPIAVCNGYLEMLDLNNKEKTRKYIEIISNEITRSKSIIDEFSNYGKLKSIEKEEIDISYLFEDVSNILNPLFKLNKAKLNIEMHQEIYINADYNKLKQVLINLLKNTIEAKQELLPLEVNINITKRKDRIIIIIEDNGIGMSKETLNQVYDIFYTTKPNGTGLGLAFCKEVIELHQGKINIASEENKGTKINITLPT